jgi:hypothetical protein
MDDYDRLVQKMEVIQDRLNRGLLSNEYLESERLVRLLDEVWLELPDLDRMVLDMQIGIVTDDRGTLDDPDYRHGATYRAQGDVLIDGVSCKLADDNDVFLNPVLLEQLTDSAAKAVIAHELSHVILRHSCLGTTLGAISALRQNEMEKAKEVHEWAADLQAWMWGFCGELRALWDETRDEPPPWYHQIGLLS